MKTFISEDQQVLKFIHEDGSETAVKFVPTIFNDVTDSLNEKKIKRMKYTVFISVSKGCHMKCSFCHLTTKGAIYQPIQEANLISNIKEAISYTLEKFPFLKKYYIKLSWMGMGDALNESEKVKNVSISILDWLVDNNLVAGLDGVDLSTVYPEFVSGSFKGVFSDLNRELKKYKINPNNKIIVNDSLENSEYQDRSLFRLFYSIHTLDIKRRDKLIPNSKNPYTAIRLLEEIEDFNVVYHYLFIDGENDSRDEIEQLKKVLQFTIPYSELRILRYNSCEKSNMKESTDFKMIIEQLIEVHKNIKVQISPGSEVKAACGQFIVEN